MQTLNDFFNTQKESKDWAGAVTDSEEFNKAKQVIAQELTGFEVPPSFYEMLIMKFCEALDIEIGNILVWGWRKRREIIQYRDQETPPTGYHEVTLLQHTLKSKHSPTIQPVINQVPLAKLTFDITLELNLDGGILFIKEGKIFRMDTGNCTGSGTVEYAGYKILEKETAKYKLPGQIPFEPAIPI